MAYKLRISVDANTDIDDIVSYLSYDLKNAQAADAFLDDVEASYHRLVDNPFIYAKCDDHLLQRRGYRKIAIKNYLVLFRIDEENQMVYIVRIVYGGRSYANML